ncbi:transmembrane protein 14C-like isoform X2 [Melanerpes formicivorus]|uniref:transmembrane protein 14C-like isoform X2 n=2 Tax=Melanerpes formicivorus TaxID=211600 RepID=UPI00358F789B
MVCLPTNLMVSSRCHGKNMRTRQEKCSVPSLAAGLVFGSLAGLGAYQLSQNPNNVWISLITSGTLTAIMGTRFYNSGKFMPAGLIAGVSLLMVGKLALKMLEKPHDK